MVEFLAGHALDFFRAWHYIGAFVMMALESMIAPIPSEVVMPPIGMLVASGELSLAGAVLATSLGSISGSLLSYAMGYFGGKPAVLKFGRFLFLNEHHLELTERWFHRHGGITIFIGRFIPVVRHLISIPAGIGKMPLLPFCAYTLVGATIWNSILLWAGMWLGDNWQVILTYRKPLDAAVIVALLGFAAYFFYSHILPHYRTARK